MNEQMPQSVGSVMVEEKRKIKKDFRLIDMIFYTVAAIVGIDTLGAVSSYGGQSLFWIIFSAITFLIPYGLLTAELGSAFPQEGGIYEWCKSAGGRFYAALASMFYWISNPLWIGGTMFVTVVATIKILGFGNANVLFGGTKATDAIITIALSLIFIWATTLCVWLPLRIGKWLATVGAILKIALLAVFVILAIFFFIGGHATGEHLQLKDLLPTGDWGLIISGILPILIFKWVGFEVQSGAGEEMQNPQRDIPRSLLQAGSIAVIAYVIPIGVILFALNKSQIANASGFMQAIDNVSVILPAPLAIAFKVLLIPAIIVTLAASGATWMGGANRTYAITALDYAAPKAFGSFSAKHGTPALATIACGVIASIVMLAAVLITSFGNGSIQSLFSLVLGFTVSINILSYVFIFPVYLILRYKYPQVKRPYKVPGGMPGAWIVTIMTTLYAIVATYFMLFPTADVIKQSGVSQVTYEATQLVALGIIILMTIVFYIWGNMERKRDEKLSRSMSFSEEKHFQQQDALPLSALETDHEQEQTSTVARR